MATELALKGLNTLMMNYTDQFRLHQRLEASVLNATPAATYLPFQVLEAQQLMYDLLEKASGAGTDVRGHFQRAVASIIHTLLYGFRIEDDNDPVLVEAVKLNDEFSEFVQVGAYIVDQFPVLNNLPGFLAPWKAQAENHFTTKHNLHSRNFQRALQSDTWNITKHLKKTAEKEMPLIELMFELGTIIDAALDGTTDSLIWFIVACVTQDQHFIIKAREELDTVIGHDRLPVPDDKPNLPYITAIVEEIFRWRPAGPEGVPHLNREEVVYNGYTIPKGSIIVPNVWTISREEAVFGADPDNFVPDRWLENDGKTLKTLPTAAFGYGRRTCPGRHLARNVIWVIVAQLLWSFDIKAGLSEKTGEPIPVDPIACTYGLVMRALPFKALFEPRGPWVREVIGGDTYSKDHAAMLNQIGAEFAKL